MPNTSHDVHIDPDYVLALFRFHVAVFHHNSDECDVDECDYCSWDNYDTWQNLVDFAGDLDTWLSTHGHLPRAWRRPRWWQRVVGRRPGRSRRRVPSGR